MDATRPVPPGRPREPRTLLLISAVALLASAAGLGLLLGLRRGDVPGLDESWMTETLDHRSGPLTAVALVFNYLGGGIVGTIVVPVGVLIALLVARRFWGALYWALAIGLSAGLVQLIKNTVNRARPPDIMVVSDHGSFPSGHTANAATLAVALSVILWRRWVAVLGVLWTLAMALSRTYLGAHWLTDTLGGILVGVGVALVVWGALELGASAISGRRRDASADARLGRRFQRKSEREAEGANVIPMSDAAAPNPMRLLLVGAGGVGDAIAKIAARRDFYEAVIVTDYDPARAQRTVAWIAAKHGTDAAARFEADRIDASDPDDVARVAREHRATHVMNAVEPKFVPTIFRGALDAGCDYLDMAMSLSEPHPADPHSETGVKLGDDQFAQAPDWESSGRLALVGMGVEPGLSDVFARYASDHLFSRIDELGTRDGANLVVTDESGEEIFAPSFSIWTTIEECLNPPVVWEKERGWFTTPPFSEPEVFEFPEGIGAVECVNVEHEEVLLMPRWLDAQRVTFKYGLGAEFIGVLKTLHLLGLDSTVPVRVRSASGPDGVAGHGGSAWVAPRDVVAAALPDPASIGPRMTGKTCAGLWVTGTGLNGAPRSTYLYHVADNAWTMSEYESQCVVWQTALNPVIALELLARGTWSGVGVLGPEAFDAKPFLDLMAAPESEGGYGQRWGLEDR